MPISKENLFYALRNLNANRSRSFLTLLSIFIGIATIFLFISFGLGLLNYIEDLKTDSSLDKISIQPQGIGAPGLDDTFALLEEDLEAIEKTSGVYEATGVYFKVVEVKPSGVRKDNKFVFLTAFDPKKPLILAFSDIGVDSGRLLRSEEKEKAVLGYNYQFDNTVFSKAIKINDKILLGDQEVRVVGFLERVGNPQDDSNIYITNEYFLDLYPNTTGYGWVVAQVDPNDIERIIERVEDSLRDSRNLEEGKEDFFVQSFQDLIDSFSSALNIVVYFVIFIALISVVVSAINTANTMVTSVLERVKEIGVIKSLGARNSEVFKIFLVESGILGFFAGTLGVLVGFVIAFLAGAALEALGWGFLSPDYPAELFIALITFATLTGALSGAWPAYNASKIKPVDALRYE